MARLHELERALRARRGGRGPDGRRPRARRRDQGAYFTPAPLVDLVVAETLAIRLSGAAPAWRSDGSPALRILDPAAGDGRFLAAAAEYLAEAAAARGFDRRRAHRAICRRCLIGIERDAEFCAEARRRLGPDVALYCTEALLAPPPELGAGTVDAVVGNPPYLRSIHLGRADADLRAALRGRYAATSHGEWDLYAAFLEQALDWVGADGAVGLVVPSRWLTAAFAGELRRKLARLCAVRAVIDFGSEQIFDGATTYASVTFLSRAPNARVEVARYSAGSWSTGEVSSSSLDARPWRLAVGGGRALLERLAAAGPPLGEVARVAKGTGTNADPVFVFERFAGDDTDATLVQVWSRALGVDVVVERDALVACVRGRDVRAYGAVDAAARALLPYERDGRLVPPEELARRWPRAAAYLARCRGLLDARERGRFAGPAYYRYGRPQNLAFLTDPAPKIVVPDVARRGRALWDDRGALVLDSAYAVRLHRSGAGASLPLLLAILNSAVVKIWLRETGVRLRGDYVRMKTAYLASLPIPARSPRTGAVEAAVADWLGRPGNGGGKAEQQLAAREIDQLVRAAYGVTPSAWAVE